MRKFTTIIILTSFFLLTTCDDLLDCIINVSPELHDKTLLVGNVDEYYSDNITAEIKNEVNDNGYDYYFDVSGNLPEGIEVFYDTYRKVVLKGIPRESGRFRFTVYLDVVALEGYYYDDFGNEVHDDPLCTDSVSKTYVLAIR